MQHPNVTPVWLTEQWRYVFKRDPEDVECYLAEMDRVIGSRTVGYKKDIELGYLFDQMLLTELVREAAQELQKHPEALEQIVTPEFLRAHPEIISYLWSFLAPYQQIPESLLRRQEKDTIISLQKDPLTIAHCSEEWLQEHPEILE